ncbi:hypothetical protein ADIMK_2118 [Marinobacterium lacunae]|uniref:Uncharacterized protein n=1 Tax=Marinobacterium lacunae TaxID=1232683 RepID=A0A081FYQ7_9GAMM|nr:hypothetical protein ADIMK_2118 [Marinobacterium lacunae]
MVARSIGTFFLVETGVSIKPYKKVPSGTFFALSPLLLICLKRPL